MFETYTRKPFEVRAVQVNMDNAEEIAAACRGRVEKMAYKIMGVRTMLPCVKVPGQGARKHEESSAPLNHWVVEMRGSWRVYKPFQFDAEFEKTTESPSSFIQLNGTLEETQEIEAEIPVEWVKGDWARVKNESSVNFGRAGTVESVDAEVITVYFADIEKTYACKRDDLERLHGTHSEEKMDWSEIKENETWVRVKNPISEQVGWVGFVQEADLENELVRVRFPDHNISISYMIGELEKHKHLV
jgi:hypothetical protein